jgi:hypothetical protein
LPEFADNSTVQVNSQTARAIIALSSLATPDPNPQNPHVNPVEGTAELAELYVGGYSAFMNAVGPELNSKGCRYYVGRPIVDALLQKEFPQADALYRFYQDNIFGGYGYGSQGNMISGKDAIPKQIGQVKFDTPSPSENPTTVLVDGQLIGTLNNGRIISIIRPSRATLAIFVPS